MSEMSCSLFILYCSSIFLSANLYQEATCVANLKHYETLSHINVKTSIKRASDGSRSLMKQLRFQVFLREFDLSIKPNTGLIADGFRVNLIHGDGSTSFFHLDSNIIFSGHLTDRPDVRVHAHREDILWSIQIYDHNDTYSIEPAWRLLTPAENPRNDTLIAYRASDMTSDSFNSSGFCGVQDNHNASVAVEESVASEKSSLESDHDLSNASGTNSETHSRDKRDNNKISCSMYMVGDFTFLKGRCRGSYVTCTAIMVSYLQQAILIYEQSVFVGYKGKTFQGIHLAVGQIYLYTTYSKPMAEYKNSHFNEERHWTIDQMLEAFSLYVGYMTSGKSYCLHHLFTDYPFPDRILGLAWMGSICSDYDTSKPSIAKGNSGISSGSDIKYGSLPTLQLTLVFLHGHSFGSEHDPNTAECTKPDTQGGSFLMWEISVSGQLPNHYKFSPCSLRWIGQFIQENKCFRNMRFIPSFCGNGVVEEDEVCDAGVHGVTDTDNCCSSQCQLRKHATCSDKNNVCCYNCSISPANTQCLSINYADCKAASYCTGSSFNCPEPLSLPDWTPCRSFGQCHSGKCWNFCEVKSFNKHHKLKECLCRSNERYAACKLCCFDITDENKPGSCTVHSNNTLRDGTLCYKGRCEKGVCMEPSASHIRRLYSYIRFIQDSSLEQFLKTNIVLLVVVLTLVLCLPCVYCISKADERELKEWKRQQSYYVKYSMFDENARSTIDLRREKSLNINTEFDNENIRATMDFRREKLLTINKEYLGNEDHLQCKLDIPILRVGTKAPFKGKIE